MNVCFFGGGNISQAIIAGLLKGGGFPAGTIACIERNTSKIGNDKRKRKMERYTKQKKKKRREREAPIHKRIKKVET